MIGGVMSSNEEEDEEDNDPILSKLVFQFNVQNDELSIKGPVEMNKGRFYPSSFSHKN
jgi:hypothetical protein